MSENRRNFAKNAATNDKNASSKELASAEQLTEENRGMTEQVKNEKDALADGNFTAQDRPTKEQLVKYSEELKYKKRFRTTLRGTIGALLVIAAAAVLVAVLLLPVLRIYGTSMTPTLSEGNYVVSIKGARFSQGDLCCFYFNNKILVKRVIAEPGDWVDIDENGLVYVNGDLLDEPYVIEPAFGECDIELPYQVPESRYFVMGDHRATSVDSRSTTIGCVSEEQIVGKIIFRVWPFEEFGKVE